jgi:hypothetical protein
MTPNGGGGFMAPRWPMLIPMLALAASAAAVPPTFVYRELANLGSIAPTDVDVVLNDRGELAFSTASSGTKRIQWRAAVRRPAPITIGFVASAFAGGPIEDLTLADITDSGAVVFFADYPSTDPRTVGIRSWRLASDGLDVVSLASLPVAGIDGTPDANASGQIAFRTLAASVVSVTRFSPLDGSFTTLSTGASWSDNVVIADDGELFADRRASSGASTGEIVRGVAAPLSPFVSAADFGGVARVHRPIDVSASKMLLFSRTDAPMTYWVKADTSSPGATQIGTSSTCLDPELNDEGWVMCVTSTGINVRNTWDFDPWGAAGVGGTFAGQTITAIGPRASYNDHGQIAFVAALSDGSTRILLATPDTCDGDRDGWCEAHDVCPGVHDPTPLDNDDDGVGDRCDNCPYHANPDQADANADGRGDACARCSPTGVPRCGSRTKGGGTDVFTISGVPLDSLPPRPGLYALARDTNQAGLTLNAAVTSCTGGNVNGPSRPSDDVAQTTDFDGFHGFTVWGMYRTAADRVGATCSVQLSADGPAGATWSYLIDSATRPFVGGASSYETTGASVDAIAELPTRATFMDEATNHRFLYDGIGGANFGTCSFDPNPPTEQEPSVVYSSATGPGWDCCTFQFDGLDGVPSSVGQIVFDVNGAPPPPDLDGDAFLAPCDSCPHLANDQNDRGGVGTTTSDGIGDACQCGEVSGDGIADAADVLRLRQRLAGSGAAFTSAELARCSTIGGAFECTVRTATVLRRALAAPALGPGVAQVCDAAVP